MKRAMVFTYGLIAPAACLLVYGRSLTAWFRTDDLSWLGFHPRITGFADLMTALFSPASHNTIRPWSERAFFILGYQLFGLHAFPFHLIVLATHIANLYLMSSIAARLFRTRAAGVWAAVFWTVNSALALPLGWISAFNQVLCAFFLLLAFHFLLLYADHGLSRYNIYQWIAFVLGFGALESIMVYPVIAASYTFAFARERFRKTLLLFAPSILFVIAHSSIALTPKTGPYAMHFTGSIFRTFFTYWRWAVSAIYPRWTIGVAIVSIALLAFLWREAAERRWAAWIGVVWFFATLALFLPLRDHVMTYALYIPLIGLCWFAGGGMAEARQIKNHKWLLAYAAAAVYLVMTVPGAVEAERQNRALTLRIRNLVLGVEQAHRTNPEKSILLANVDDQLFWDGVNHHPFRLVGANNVYLAPGSDARISTEFGTRNALEWTLPGAVTSYALAAGELQVLDAVAPGLPDITAAYTATNRFDSMPTRVDAGIRETGFLLGRGWYYSEGKHRWMADRASLRMAGPARDGLRLYILGYCPAEQVPVELSVQVNHIALPTSTITHDHDFELWLPLPPALTGAPDMQVDLLVSRTFRPPGSDRYLGLSFGVFELRKEP